MFEYLNDCYENCWYVDIMWCEVLQFGVVLCCVECLFVGGDIMWVNMVLVYEKLFDDVKCDIVGLCVCYSIEVSFGVVMLIEKCFVFKVQYFDLEYFVVCIYFEIDEKVLYVNGFMMYFMNYYIFVCVCFGQDVIGGVFELLCYFISQVYIFEYQVCWCWRFNSVVIWDNIVMQYYVVMDYVLCYCKMECVGIIGGKLF